MAHLAGAGPLGEFYLRHQFGLHPGGCRLVFDALTERRLLRPQWPQLAVKLFEDGMCEAWGSCIRGEGSSSSQGVRLGGLPISKSGVREHVSCRSA